MEGKVCCRKLRQSGSHAIVRCDCGEFSCQTTVPIHKGRDLPRGTLAAIRRDLAMCLGQGWI
ncbi:MAG: type II toxin-antitoxin system HicA family toxin [Acidimicrobiia bacterium]|nr:type II toxin-antitoxin system HicA family toxin [Acidimicrobiia bacterium]